MDSSNSIKQFVSRIGRVPKRCRRDLKIMRQVSNWREVLTAKLRRERFSVIKFRNGAILTAPPLINLPFLFDETWVEELYRGPDFGIGPGDLVIDVGANIGTFAIYAATRAAGVRVLAFEPFPENVTWLRKNIAESGLQNIEVFEGAVAASSEDRLLHVSSTDWITHALNGNGEGSPISVRCKTLDEVLQEVGRCDLLKLDCEGSEYEIIYHAAPETLARIKRIVGEYHQAPGGLSSGAELMQYLTSRSFVIDWQREYEFGEGVFCATRVTRGVS
jgi:FkbM family methyltransferase